MAYNETGENEAERKANAHWMKDHTSAPEINGAYTSVPTKTTWFGLPPKVAAASAAFVIAAGGATYAVHEVQSTRAVEASQRHAEEMQELAFEAQESAPDPDVVAQKVLKCVQKLPPKSIFSADDPQKTCMALYKVTEVGDVSAQPVGAQTDVSAQAGGGFLGPGAVFWIAAFCVGGAVLGRVFHPKPAKAASTAV